MKKLMLLSLAGFGVASCSNNNPQSTYNYYPAGSIIESGSFGAATNNNMLAQTGQLDLTITMAHRFAAEVNSMVNFPFNSTALDTTARATLRRQATWIRQFPEVRFKVYGHTDLVGDASYNRDLGLRRAQAVVLYLATQGISRSRLEAVVSFGETQPLIVTEDKERRNRRTVTEVSGFVQNDGRSLNGKYAAVIFREYVTGATQVSNTE